MNRESNSTFHHSFALLTFAIGIIVGDLSLLFLPNLPLLFLSPLFFIVSLLLFLPSLFKTTLTTLTFALLAGFLFINARASPLTLTRNYLLKNHPKIAKQSLQNFSQVIKDPPPILKTARNSFASGIKNSLEPLPANLSLGYLLGLKSDLDKNLKSALSLIGLTHIIVASGTHLSILISSTKRLTKKFSRKTSTLTALLALSLFLLLIGDTPSMSRAGLVSFLSISTLHFGRKFKPENIIILAIAITLIKDPFYPTTLAWMLSFASYLGILLLSPKLTILLYPDKKPGKIASLLLPTLSATLTTTPITAYNFGTISLLTPLANLLILPTMPLILALSFLTGLSALIFPSLNPLFALPANFLLNLHINITFFLAKQTPFIFEIKPTPLIFLIYLPLLLILLAKTRPLCYNSSMDKITLVSELDLINFGKSLAKNLSPNATIQLIGDVGAGKTTLTKGIAAGLNISETITSPTFTISNLYHFNHNNTLTHYDFYRLDTPGIMSEDLTESIQNPKNITIIEWSDTVKDLLPQDTITIHLSINSDQSRTVTINPSPKNQSIPTN